MASRPAVCRAFAAVSRHDYSVSFAIRSEHNDHGQHGHTQQCHHPPRPGHFRPALARPAPGHGEIDPASNHQIFSARSFSRYQITSFQNQFLVHQNPSSSDCLAIDRASRASARRQRPGKSQPLRGERLHQRRRDRHRRNLVAGLTLARETRKHNATAALDSIDKQKQRNKTSD